MLLACLCLSCALGQVQLVWCAVQQSSAGVEDQEMKFWKEKSALDHALGRTGHTAEWNGISARPHCLVPDACC